jgi:hypothetical protein
MHQQEPALPEHLRAVAHEPRQVGVLGEVRGGNAIKGLARAVILGARAYELDVLQPALTDLFARERKVLLAQLDADDAALREAPGDRNRRNSGSAGEVENARGARRDFADDAPLPQLVDAEGGDIDDDVVRVAGAAEKPLDEREPRIAQAVLRAASS